VNIERPGDALYPEIREGVRALCAQFPPSDHRSIDAAPAYPEAFVDALTRAGWLAALIPTEYGGLGLGLAEASVNQPCGTQANMAKYLAAKASWEAANAALQFHGGCGFACDCDVERKFRETRLYQEAPISTNLILSHVAEHVLGLARSI
jgi:alkylation response protein AidB-like acyl-CoA dehydrogenase